MNMCWATESVHDVNPITNRMRDYDAITGPDAQAKDHETGWSAYIA